MTLTPRQRQVARLIAEGHTNAHIGSVLGISADAVKGYVSILVRKVAPGHTIPARRAITRWVLAGER